MSERSAHQKGLSVDLSIIIPTYNRLWSLPETIESCRNDKCRMEIIVIDDGSTDGTLQWLMEQKEIIVLHQNNLGKCWAVNKGMTVAKGKYIRFLDSDDQLDEGANDQQFELAELNNADLVVSGCQDFNNDGQLLGKVTYPETDDFIAQQLGEGNGSHYSAFLFKKELINEIPHRPDFAFRDDRLFILEVALKDPVIAVHTGTALLHRVAHQDRLQINSGLQQQVQNYQHLQLYKRILNRLTIEKKLTQRRIKAATNVLWPLAHWIAIYDLGEAKNIINWIHELDPEFAPPEKGVLGALYKKLGFSVTEKLLRFRRKLLFR